MVVDGTDEVASVAAEEDGEVDTVDTVDTVVIGVVQEDIEDVVVLRMQTLGEVDLPVLMAKIRPRRRHEYTSGFSFLCREFMYVRLLFHGVISLSGEKW